MKWIYAKYALLNILNLIFTGIAYIFAPLYVLFTSEDGWLPKWLYWFQTQDNSLDAGWKLQGNFGTYLKDGTIPTGYTRYKYRVQWCWRNPAYGFCYYPLGIPVKPEDWIIDEYKVDANGNRVLLKAHSTTGYFAYTTDANWKLGWKIWSNFSGLDKDGKPVWSDKPWGPELRTSLCFSFPNPFKKKS